MADEKKIFEHPHFRLQKRIDELEKEVQALKIDQAVLKDLLLRTINIMARYEKAGVLRLPAQEQ